MNSPRVYLAACMPCCNRFRYTTSVGPWPRTPGHCPFADDRAVVELQQVLNCVDDLSNPAVPVDLNRQAELVVLIENVQKSH